MKTLAKSLSANLILLVASVAVSAQDLQTVFKRVKPSVVAITTYNSDGKAFALGSGFFLSRQIG